jgi:hypothetical protein
MTIEPQSQAPAPVPWARQPSAKVEPATKRIRRPVENLPEWEPLPPGEILVRRSRQQP